MDLPLQGSRCCLRRWSRQDADGLARHADERGIWRNLRDAFPHPYTLEDAREYLELVADAPDPDSLCIEVDGEAAGGIGVKRQNDVERVGAEIGYWLGKAHWGRGIVSEAVALATPFFLETFDLTRVFALPFARNVPSVRVLEKAGYVLEGRLRRSAIKDGVVEDQLLFAFVPEPDGDSV